LLFWYSRNSLKWSSQYIALLIEKSNWSICSKWLNLRKLL
jgi:hypothetical protein